MQETPDGRVLALALQDAKPLCFEIQAEHAEQVGNRDVNELKNVPHMKQHHVYADDTNMW